jgi:UDP-N-acetylmuramoyl-tripeptide--D-alanyl-D-alanine ligase
MAAACIGNYFQVDPLKIQAAIKNYRPQNNRSQLIEKNGLQIIMDAYNANPTSMQASIESFVSFLSAPTVSYFGDMLELGDQSLKSIFQYWNKQKNTTLKRCFLLGRFLKKQPKIFRILLFQMFPRYAVHLTQNP